ncbi:SWI/SNF chromatin-remodeling complex subunit, partial [Coemansia sp. RSA 2598]
MESSPSVLRQMLLDEYAQAKKRLCRARAASVPAEAANESDVEAEAEAAGERDGDDMVSGSGVAQDNKSHIAHVDEQSEARSAPDEAVAVADDEAAVAPSAEPPKDPCSSRVPGLSNHDADDFSDHEQDRAESPQNDDVAVPSSAVAACAPMSAPVLESASAPVSASVSEPPTIHAPVSAPAYPSATAPATAHVDKVLENAARSGECIDSRSDRGSKDVADDEYDKDDEPVWVDDELRVVIRIDIVIGHIALRDQFEWDVAPLLRPLDANDLRDQFLASLDEESQRVPPSSSSSNGAIDKPASASGQGTRSRAANSDDGKDNDDDDDDDVPMSPAASVHGPSAEEGETSADKNKGTDTNTHRDAQKESDLLHQWVHGAIEGQMVTPEQVSRVICAEKCLGGEFETAIAHAIREQLYAFVKSFLLAGYTYRPRMMTRKQAQAQAQASRIQQRLIQIDDKELARSILPPVVSVERDLAATQTFAPLIAHLHTVDAERLEKDSERETRRKRRQGRGRGRAGAGAAAAGPTPTGGAGMGSLLPPDREVHRTNRTMIPLPSWFDDELPPDTRSFVETPGEGAHFLDSYEMRANYEAQSLATVGNGSAPAAIAALGSAAGIAATGGSAIGGASA